MKIIELAIENVKRLTAVEIRPHGAVVTVGGRNAQGKSSVLDSIAMALGGKDLVPDEPIRRGAERARTVVDLGDYVVTRTFTAAGSSLSVTGKDGSKIKSPQALLDSLVGRISFDPMAFTKLKPAEQRAELARVIGFDLDAYERKRAALVAERTEARRARDAAIDRLGPMPTNVPASLVDLRGTIQAVESAGELAATAERARAYVDDLKHERDRGLVAQATWSDKVAALEKELAAARARVDAITARMTALNAEIIEAESARDAAAAKVPDVSAAMSAIEAGRAANARFEAAVHWKAERDALRTLEMRAEAADDAVKDHDAERETWLAEASFPIPGLGFDDRGVTLNGLPLDQASTAEQIRTSVAIGMAANPEVRVMLVREGSLLDDASLALLGECAEAWDAQVWVERVTGDPSAVQVLIENGAVRVDE